MKPAHVSEEGRLVSESLQQLALRIRTSRERMGMTQEEFANRSGISVSFASLLERGERSPSYETLLQISAALSVHVSDLFRDGTPEEPVNPGAVRLGEFQRRAQLSMPQIDRLIAVAHAMFDVRPVAQAEPVPVKRAGGCSEPGCEKAVLAKGLCASHYHRARRAGQK